MAQKLIRGIPHHILRSIQAKAGEAGISAETWIRQKLIELAAEPTVKERYVFRMYGPGQAHATLQRYGDGCNEEGEAAADGSVNHLSSKQMEAYVQAGLLMQRNAPGDREEAQGLLSKQFEIVLETAL